MEVTITEESAWIVLGLSGPGTAEELKAAYLLALEAAESASLSAIIIESTTSRIHPEFDDMRDLAKFALSLRNSNPPRTAVIVGDSFQFGLARMFASLVEFTDWEFRIFRSVKAAEEWLKET